MKVLALTVPDIGRGPKIVKVGKNNVTTSHFSEIVLHIDLQFMAKLHFKSEFSSFISNWRYSGSPKSLKVCHITSFQPPLT